MVFLKIESLPIISVVAFLVGVALGFGYPSCLSYFADSVSPEDKGKLGGIAFFAAFLGTFLIGFLTGVLGFVESVLVFTVWRVLGFMAFHMLKDKKSEDREKRAGTKYKVIVSETPFLLYVVPWTMVCLVNFFVGPLQEHYWSVDVFNSVLIVEFGIASVAALIGGYFADVIGRKRVVILGYVLLGVGYAVLSILPTSNISISVYTIFDGIAWGLFFLVFLLVVWGDLAGSKEREKYYFLGALPFLISSYVWVIVAPFANMISISASFSLASFFLFLAVVPLMYAPETLPETETRRRELREYIEKAKKMEERRG
jgi:MFS family permease